MDSLPVIGPNAFPSQPSLLPDRTSPESSHSNLNITQRHSGGMFTLSNVSDTNELEEVETD